jgi:hypothetical protein
VDKLEARYRQRAWVKSLISVRQIVLLISGDASSAQAPTWFVSPATIDVLTATKPRSFFQR